jgi:hypothetical protein
MNSKTFHHLMDLRLYKGHLVLVLHGFYPCLLRRFIRVFWRFV